jgi:TolB-like protein/DNA-binding winged helix-turn-helix (wHTH) protein/Tfp pilus assembly protein PilF
MEMGIEGSRVRFGVFEVDRQARELRKSGIRIKLEGQPFEVLAALLDKPGQVVTRGELQARVWPEGTFVDFDKSLTKAINRIRVALGDSAETPRFIETLSRRGYRFIAPVEPIQPQREAAAGPVAALPEEKRPLAGVSPSRVPLRVATVIAITRVLLTAAGVVLWRHFRIRPLRSLAVLPFADLSKAPDREYFVDGMTEALITDLAQISQLRVISRTSVMQYKHTTKPLPVIGRELNVDAIVEGAVVSSGNRVRVTAQLLEAATDRHVWAGTYERDLADVLILQNELATAITREIRAKLSSAEQQRFAQVRRVSPAAYEAYLRGRHLLGTRRGNEYARAAEYLEQAVSLQPDYAAAYAALAEYYVLLLAHQRAPRPVPLEEGVRKVKAAARRALEIDPSLGEAHTSLGHMHTLVEWNWPAAEQELRKAVELSPNFATGHAYLGFFLALMGRFEEAISELERAHELDPLSPILNVQLGHPYLWSRRYHQAIEHYQKALEIDPAHTYAWQFLGEAYEGLGRYGDALRAFAQENVTRGVLPARTDLGWHGFWEARLQIMERQRIAGQEVRDEEAAYVCARLGKADRMFYWLERAVQEHEDAPARIKWDKVFDPFRSDPRFTGLLQRMALAPLPPAPAAARRGVH